MIQKFAYPSTAVPQPAAEFKPIAKRPDVSEELAKAEPEKFPEPVKAFARPYCVACGRFDDNPCIPGTPPEGAVDKG